jgi:germination protein M
VKRLLVIMTAAGLIVTPAATPASGASSHTVTLGVWLQRGAHMWLTKRTLPATPRVATAAITALLAGPSSAERAAGVSTAIPAGTRLQRISIDSGVATVSLTAQIGAGAGAPSVRMRLAELTYTVTQFPSVQAVRLQVNGRLVHFLTADGVPVPIPLQRWQFRALMPTITVWSPQIGSSVSSPALIMGTANVFEANVHVAILNAAGKVIARTVVTASCGSGCRGNYSLHLAYTVPHDMPGSIVLSNISARTGKPVNLQRVPVTLQT